MQFNNYNFMSMYIIKEMSIKRLILITPQQRKKMLFTYF